MKTLPVSTRRGSVYPMVLATATVVAMIGVAGILVQRRMFARAEDTLDTQRASVLARSAVELGLQRISTHSDWRSRFGGGTWYKAQPARTGANAGTMTLTVTDPTDNSIGDSSKDPVLLTGVGEYGGARRTVAALYTQAMIPDDSIEVAACFEDDAEFAAFSTTIGTGVLHTDKQAKASSAQVHTPVRVGDKADGMIYHGGTATVATRSVPSAATVISTYLSAGATTINRSSLPQRAGVYYLENLVLSPTSNPFGSGNAQGVYYLDMGDRPLVIQNCRIHGTLLVRRPKNDQSKVTGSVHIAPAVKGYPTLVVSGKGMTFQLSGSPLSEPDLGVNFNPPAAPYLGASDTANDDTYECLIDGIVLVEEDVTIAPGTSRFKGHLMGERKLYVQTGGTLQLDGGTDSFKSPPPGFGTAGDFQVASWTRSTD